jgi:hypothetical protein
MVAAQIVGIDRGPAQRSDVQHPRTNTGSALRWRKAGCPILGKGWRRVGQTGAEAMSLYVLDVMIRILGIRGHIPQHDNFHAAQGGSPLGAGDGTLLRVLIAVVASLAVLALLLWAAVWLAIRLL